MMFRYRHGVISSAMVSYFTVADLDLVSATENNRHFAGSMCSAHYFVAISRNHELPETKSENPTNRFETSVETRYV